LWNPLLAAGITFAFGGTADFLRSWFLSVVISEVVALLCFTSAHVVRRIELWVYRLRHRPAPSHDARWYWLVAGIAMPFALRVGFSVEGAVARWLGFAWARPNFGSYRVGLGFGLLLMLLFFFLRAQSEAREAARVADARIKSLEASRLEARLAALTAEMNPHLLFNALNTVASLIHTDPDRAEDVVLQLSDMYRGVLRASGEATHALDEELRLCQAYLKIEEARFGERLGARIEVAPDVALGSIQVPVLILQPFVENAVKHGISTRGRGGNVQIRVAERDQLLTICVQDDGVGIGNSGHQGAGRAMSNCKDRLKLTYGERAQLNVGEAAGGGTEVVIEIPMTADAERVS
jgi:signal transduction histidine kinase